MDRTINAKELRATLPDIVRRVRRGERFTVLYRSRPAFRVVPVGDRREGDATPLADEPLYRAAAVGRSRDGLSARDHDAVLYGGRRR
jgi:prevent-host-death family protein